ncbi:MAG: peptidoglycan DD-metalloendopeptidase family protein [Leptolyngbyaceae cyanobacterium SM2_5_2]|nr:peptidoglycan DD-metalloendopeptidase family protein [Leptolyngbyaceae cyanobacterium SM2_5_2]
MAVAPLQGSVEAQQGMSGVCRQQVNAPVSVLGMALSLGASASLVSFPGLAFAAEGSTVVVLPAVDDVAQETGAELETEADESSATAYHTVAEGDSLWEIAAQHQADVSTLKAVNGISQDDVLRVGQVLRVPPESVSSTLVSGAPAMSTFSIGTTTGSVGGDVPTLNPSPAAVAVLSVDELEKAWVSLDEANAQPGQVVPQPDDVEQLKSDNSATATVDDNFSEKASLMAVELETEATASSEAAPAAEALAEVAPKTTTPEAPAAWQDASVQLAAAQPAEEVSEQPAVAAASSQAASALPESIPLHDATSHSRSATASLNRSAEVSPSLGSSSTASQGKTGEAATPAPLSQPQPVPAQPVAQAEPTTSVVAVVEPTPLTREQVIREHLARIRESNAAQVNRDELNARIRQARQELERARVGRVEESAPAPRLNGSALQVAPAAEPSSTSLASAALATSSVEPKQASTQLQAWTVTDVAEVEAEAVPLAADQVAAAPRQALPTSSEPAAADRPPAIGGEQLLAAAPLGAEVYSPFPQVPTGQMVSPDMPMLPGADQFLPDAPNRFNGYIWPTRGTFTSGYGWRWGRMHRGIDIAGPVGTPIVAAASGVVVRSGWNSGGYGNLVDIRHPDGSMTRYAHNSRLLVREGQQVSQGQHIAAMGSTGYSTGPHLHFEIHLPGSGTVNPMAHLPGR